MTRKKTPLPSRLTPEERHAFVMAYANGSVFASNHIPGDLISLVFMPIALGAHKLFAGWTKRDFAKIGLIWADTARDQTTGQAVNGYPIFVSCRLMLKVDWDELRPAIQAELDRRKAVKP